MKINISSYFSIERAFSFCESVSRIAISVSLQDRALSVNISNIVHCLFEYITTAIGGRNDEKFENPTTAFTRNLKKCIKLMIAIVQKLHK